jgi:hypothetical protein
VITGLCKDEVYELGPDQLQVMGMVDVAPPVNVRFWFGVAAVQIKLEPAVAVVLAGIVFTVTIMVKADPMHEPVVEVGVTL